MADAFSHSDTKSLLKSKHILFLGDSNIRAQYKDLVWLLNFNTLVPHASLRSKLEVSYLGDTLIHRSKLDHGRDYQEVRGYYDRNSRTKVDFMFISRCYNNKLEEMFRAFRRKSKPAPDVIVMNSCLWDLCRWGPNGVPEYKDNMVKLMRMMSCSLPKQCLVIWTTALPTGPHVRGGLLLKQIAFMEPLLRFEVMEANTFARDVVAKHGFDVLDSHYHTRMQMHRRAKDGVHYMPIPVRLMTNLLLTHISLSWGNDLPGNICSGLLSKAIALDSNTVELTEMKIPTNGIFSKINLPSPTVSRTRGIKITFNTDEERAARSCKVLQEELPDFTENTSLKELENFPGPGRGYSGISQKYRHFPNHQVPYPAAGGPYRNRNKKKNKNKRKDPYRDNRYNYRY